MEAPQHYFPDPRRPGPAFQAALRLLLQAGAAAPPGQGSREAGFVEGQRLRAAGLADAELRWLLDLQLVEGRPSQPRSPSPGGPVPPGAARFRLTAVGVLWARQFLAPRQFPPPGPCDGPPCWDAERRQLTWGGRVLLSFARRHAPNLGLVLTAFQQQGWKPSVANPLTPEAGFDAADALKDAVKYINKLLIGTGLRFHRSGDGRGVCWKRLPEDFLPFPPTNR